jgi:hypothetical protein
MAVIPAILEAKIGRTAVKGQSRQKVYETPTQPIKAIIPACHPKVTGSTNKRVMVLASQGIHVRPYLRK